jgi:nitrile hydratase
MNGGQDLGGVMGFGPIAPEPDEPVFHADWEKRALALTLAAGALGEWNIDRSRHARENRSPADYLTSSYYELWSKGLSALLAAHGLVGEDELRAGRALHPARSTRRPPLRLDDVAAALSAGSPYDRPPSAPAAFAVGETVRSKVAFPTGHTRLPRYAMGKRGVIAAVHGAFVFPDSNAAGRGEDPRWCYGVRFDGRELWGPGADPTLEVMIDLWEPYLEPAA